MMRDGERIVRHEKEMEEDEAEAASLEVVLVGGLGETKAEFDARVRELEMIQRWPKWKRMEYWRRGRLAFFEFSREEVVKASFK